jgi:two-component sensor histidine kinase
MPRERPARDSTAEASGTYPSERGILAIRQSLGFGPEEEALVRQAEEHLAGEVERWVDEFYVRLFTDPVAMRLLDDARVIRLKRSLTAWFHELFALPFDEAYERARASIGLMHVRLHMPLHLMVVAFGGLRRDVTASVRRIYSGDAARRDATQRAMELALDLELSLMLEAYRRHSRQRSRQLSRVVYTAQARRRAGIALRDRLDAALCFAELARSAEGEERLEALARLSDVVRGLSASAEGLAASRREGLDEARSVPVRSLLVDALDNIACGPGIEIRLAVEPPDLAALLLPEAVGMAVEEILQNAVTHAGATHLALEARAEPDGGVALAVTDDGTGWDAGIRQIEDVRRLGEGVGLALCELVASLHGGRIELFQPPTGGAGVRMVLAGRAVM